MTPIYKETYSVGDSGNEKCTGVESWNWKKEILYI